VAAAVAAIAHLGSPADARLRRLDDQRVRHLKVLSSGIEEHWKRHGKLPASVVELALQPWQEAIERDPETRQPYEYEPRAERSYRLCAEFALASPEPRSPREREFWRHPAGRHCFDLEITVESDAHRNER
jgi:hypothetical protein